MACILHAVVHYDHPYDHGRPDLVMAVGWEGRLLLQLLLQLQSQQPSVHVSLTTIQLAALSMLCTLAMRTTPTLMQVSAQLASMT